MLIVHMAYEESNFFLWGESSFDSLRLESAEAEGGCALPWGAKHTLLRSALRDLGIRAPRRSSKNDNAPATVLLPSQDGIPLPSDPILGELPDSCAKPVLLPFRIETVSLSLEKTAQLALLARESGDRLAHPGILFADDLKFVCRAFEYAASCVRRGSYVPDMERRGDLFVSRWKPLVLAKDQKEFSSFAAAVPAVLCAFSSNPDIKFPISRVSCANNLLEGIVDSLVRASQSDVKPKRRADKNATPHELWLRSLISQNSILDNVSGNMPELYEQVRSWDDSRKSFTAQPWKFFIRLEEPAFEGDDWTLSWHLQSARDSGVVVSADRVWNPTETERKWFAYTGTNPRRYMLQILGKLALRLPYVAESLNTACPCECFLSADELIDFLKNQLPEIIDSGIQVRFPRAWGDFSSQPKLSVRAKVREQSGFSIGGSMSLGDLLDVDWSVALGDELLTAEEFAMLTELKSPIVNLHGRWMVIYREEIEKITAALKKLPDQISRKEALYSALRGEFAHTPMSETTGSPWLDGLGKLLSGEEPLEEMAAPQGFAGTLRPYQAKGLAWLFRLVSLGIGACLADDMGLGKTVQTLALIKSLRVGGEKRPILLICPTSVMENWRREAARFVPDLEVTVHHGANRGKKELFTNSVLAGKIVISSYALLHCDRDLFSEIEWAGVILDEAQNIKNPDTQQSRAARALRADWHIALTGTPVENHVGDMWSIMEFLMPGLLPNRTRFTREFLHPVQAGDKTAAEKIRRMTAPFILRRLKSDKAIISDLPDKIESKEFCSLSREQATLYNAVTKSLTQEIKGTEGIQRRGMVLAAMTALKQICDHPLLYLKDNSEIERRSGKLTRLAEISEELVESGGRALIFTQYAEMGELLKKYLQENFGKEVLFLHGRVPKAKRDEMVSRFQQENGPIFFVLSIKAGGTGLNLTRANHVIVFDRWWNPAVEQQAVDRAYRIGQKESVHVHYFSCRGTLEEKIEAVIESKKELANEIVGTGEGWLSNMSDKELRELFKLDKETAEAL